MGEHRKGTPPFTGMAGMFMEAWGREDYEEMGRFMLSANRSRIGEIYDIRCDDPERPEGCNFMVPVTFEDGSWACGVDDTVEDAEETAAWFLTL